MKCEVLSRQWKGKSRGSIVEVSEEELEMHAKDLKPLSQPKPKKENEPKPEHKKKSLFGKKKKKEDDE